jgi:membrane-associated phospholipid phosphatase
MMRDIPETMAVPALLLALLAGVIGSSGLDIPLFLGMNTAFGYLPDAFWANVTLLGDALVTLALLTLLASRYPMLLPAGLLAGLLATLLTRSLKPLLAIDRPLAVLGEQVHVIGIDLHNFSFPSGHTTAAFVLAGVYALVLQRDRLTAVLFCAALMVGLSRIAVGAHWPLDVLSGAAIGWSCAWAGWKLAGHWHWSQTRRGQQVLTGIFLLFSLLLFTLKTGYPQAFWLQTGIAGVATLACLLTLWNSGRT